MGANPQDCIPDVVLQLNLHGGGSKIVKEMEVIPNSPHKVMRFRFIDGGSG